MVAKSHLIVRRRSALCAALAVVFACLSTAAYAQGYKTLPVDQAANSLRMSFASAARNPAGLGASQADVEKYLKGYYLPTMSLFTADALKELGKSREQLFKLLQQVPNAGTRDYINEIIFTYARGMARGNFHPAVRYNAVLMLGDLDQQLASGTTPPVPMPKATQELLELVEKDEFNKVPVPESVKLGALIGLERQSRYGIDPSLNQRLTAAMIKVAGSPTPEDVDADVHDWVRRTAAQVLANQAKQGPTKEVQAALTALIADKKVDLDERCNAAAALKRITYPANADIDGNAAVDALAQLTSDVVAEAAKLARDYQKEALAGADFSSRGGGGYGGGRGYGGGEYGGGRSYGSGEEETGPRFERRQVFARLYNIGTGATSLKAGLADEQQTRLDAIIGELKPTMQTIENKDNTDVPVTKKVIELETVLKQLVPAAKPAEEAAAAAAPEKEDEALAENEN
jgi:uncharacterized membrane protein YgcG